MEPYIYYNYHVRATCHGIQCSPYNVKDVPYVLQFAVYILTNSNCVNSVFAIHKSSLAFLGKPDPLNWNVEHMM